MELGIYCPLRYNVARPMPKPTPEKPDLHSEEFLHSLMRKQLKLSIVCALAFLVVLLGLPLANYFWPKLMATRVLNGFTLTWFLLGIGFFPAVKWPSLLYGVLGCRRDELRWFVGTRVLGIVLLCACECMYGSASIACRPNCPPP